MTTDLWEWAAAPRPVLIYSFAFFTGPLNMIVDVQGRSVREAVANIKRWMREQPNHELDGLEGAVNAPTLSWDYDVDHTECDWTRYICDVRKPEWGEVE